MVTPTGSPGHGAKCVRGLDCLDKALGYTVLYDSERDRVGIDDPYGSLTT